MKIDYTLDREDFLEFQLFAASKSERIIKSRKNSRIRLPIVYLILGVILFFLTDLTFALIFLSIGLIWYLFHPYFMRKRYVRHFGKYIDETLNNRFGKTVSLTFGDDFIQEIDYMGESILKKKEIIEINEIKDYVYLKFSSGESLIVPKNKINNLQEFSNQIKLIASDLSISYNIDLNWKWK